MLLAAIALTFRVFVEPPPDLARGCTKPDLNALLRDDVPSVAGSVFFPVRFLVICFDSLGYVPMIFYFVIIFCLAG